VEMLLSGRFIRIPRIILDNLFYGQPDEKRNVYVYLYLLYSCFFRYGVAKVGFQFFECGPGEFVRQKRDIFRTLGINRYQYDAAIDELASRGLVKTETGKNHIRIIVPCYEAITGQAGQAGRKASVPEPPGPKANANRHQKEADEPEPVRFNHIDVVPYPDEA